MFENLTKKTTLRTIIKDATNSQIEKIIANLNSILEERAEEEAKRKEALALKTEAIEKIKSAMKEANIDIADLNIDPVSTQVSRGKKAEAKYAIVDEKGNRHEWSGRGRTPKIFDEYMARNAIEKDGLPSA